MLDWAFSPYVALFFAFQDSLPQVKLSSGKEPELITASKNYRMLYALNADSLKPTCSKDKIACKVHGQCLKETLDKCLPGIINNPRVVAQSGMLVYMKKIIEETSSGSIERSIPLDEILLSCSTDKSQFSLIKIYMREDFRDLVLTLLNTMNINGRTLFPELLGAGKYANMAMDIVDYDPMMKIFNTV